MADPIDGVVYWFDWVNKVWMALWRETLVVTPDPDPGTGYGAGGYGDGLYGG